MLGDGGGYRSDDGRAERSKGKSYMFRMEITNPYNDLIRPRIVQQNSDRGRQDYFHLVGGESGLFGDDLDGFRLPVFIAGNGKQGPQPGMGVDLEIFNIV
jgi:hypothetical protein